MVLAALLGAMYVSDAAQADNEWTRNPATAGSWDTATNWLIPLLPMPTDNVLIVNGGTSVISTGTATARTLVLGGTSSSGGLRIDGGLLTLGTELVMGSGSAGVGAVAHTAGSVTGTSMTLGRGRGSRGTYDLSGGTLTLSGSIALGAGIGSSARMTQTGGTVGASTLSLGVGASSGGTYVLSGGTLALSGPLSIAASGVTGVTGTFTISDGVFRTGSSTTIGSGSAAFNAFAALDMTGGTASLGGVTVRPNGRFSMTGGSGSANVFTVSSGTFSLSNGSLAVQSISTAGSAVGSLASGTLISRGAATIGGTFSQSGGTFGLASLAVNANSLYSLTGGTIASSATGTTSGTTTLSLSGTLQLDGSGVIAPLSRITLSGSRALFDQRQSDITVNDLAVNAGTYRISAGTLGISNSWTLGTTGTMDFANGAAAVTVSPGAAVNLSQGSIVNSGSASLTILGTSGFLIVPSGFNPSTAFGSFVNEGTTYTVGSTIIVQNGRSIDLAGTVKDPIDTAGTINLTDSTIALADVSLASSGVITGVGSLTVEGAAVRGKGVVTTDLVVASGTVAPGFSPGTLTLGGNMTLDSASRLSIEVFGTSAAQYDQLVVGGITTLSGSLAVTLGAALPVGLRLTIIDNQSSSPIVGGFGSAVSAVWASDIYTFSIDYASGNGNDMTLTLADVSPTSPPLTITVDVASGVKSQSEAGFSTLSGTVPVAKTGVGTLVLDQLNTLTGSMTVQAGRLHLANSSALGESRLVPLAGGTVTLAPGMQTTVGGLAPSAGGLVDVGNGMVTVLAQLIAPEMVAAIVSGRGDGSWNGTSGITSSVAAASGGSRTVGWLENGDGSVTFAFAAAGDTNLDGLVDIIDGANFLAGGRFDSGPMASWNEGDFTYDGMVDILDAADFLSTGLFDAGFYNQAAGNIAPVPEPSAVGLVGVGLGFAGVLSVRRKRAGLTCPPLARPPSERESGCGRN
jgi:fibronectin-binding autotransporter adhesin